MKQEQDAEIVALFKRPDSSLLAGAGVSRIGLYDVNPRRPAWNVDGAADNPCT
jgi:hypothetical protein